MRNLRSSKVWVVVLVGGLIAGLVGGALSAQEAAPISGVYELVLGTPDALPTLEYLQQYGYRVDRHGELDADSAEKLYGVRSKLRGIRLAHGSSDHGLYRLMIWDQPLGEGLGLAPMKVLGGRWGAAVTRDVYAIVNHAEDAVAQELPVLWVEPQRQVIYSMGDASRPFLDPAVCVREMLLVRPETRQILFQRYGYELPLYGRIAEESHLASSQVTHAGLILKGGPEQLEFYDQVLGLRRARHGHISDDSDPASKAVFDLQPGERYMSTDFDDPRSVPSDLSKVRSGRLKIIRFLDDPEIPDLTARSRPGHLGLTLYTYRVQDIEDYHARVSASAATAVTPILRNEFGEPSFSFVAPDGYFWNLLGAR